MNGQLLVNQIRTVLRDRQSGYAQGEFWQDWEILQALNIAQDKFVDYCLRDKKWARYLAGLQSSYDYTVINILPYVLPADYLHYVSAIEKVVIDDIVSYRTAGIYLGGDGVNYFSTSAENAIILGGNIYFIDNREPLGTGILYYYHYPTIITKNIFQSSFSDYVYNSYICDYATVCLGMKDTQSTRDVRVFKRYVKQLMTQPITFDNYIQNKDLQYGRQQSAQRT